PGGASWVSGFTKGSVRSCAAGPLRAVRGRTRGAARGISGVRRCCGPVRPGRVGVGFGGRGGVGGGRGDVVRAPGVLAGALHPGGDPRAERLATSDDQLDRLSAGGTRVLFAAHALRVGPGAAQRSLLYARTITPLPKVRTESRVNGRTEKPAVNIGRPAPCTIG